MAEGVAEELADGVGGLTSAVIRQADRRATAVIRGRNLFIFALLPPAAEIFVSILGQPQKDNIKNGPGRSRAILFCYTNLSGGAVLGDRGVDVLDDGLAHQRLQQGLLLLQAQFG